MSLEFIDWERNGILVLNLSGRITLGAGTRRLRELIREALEINRTDIILNLAEVVHIDSSGLGELVSAHTSVRRQGGHLKLIGLTSRSQDLLNLTKLHTVFEVFHDEEAALKSFDRPGQG